MFGKHWTAARGTIVDRRGHTSGDGTVTTYEFVVDVTTADGEVFRAKADEPRIATDFKDPLVGAEVSVEYDPESRRVRFDKDDPALSWKHYKKTKSDNFDAVLAAPPGTPAATPGLGGFEAGQLPDRTQLPDMAELQALLQAQGLPAGAFGSAQVVQMQSGSPEAAAVRDALLRAFGGAAAPAALPDVATPADAPSDGAKPGEPSTS